MTYFDTPAFMYPGPMLACTNLCLHPWAWFWQSEAHLCALNVHHDYKNTCIVNHTMCAQCPIYFKGKVLGNYWVDIRVYSMQISLAKPFNKSHNPYFSVYSV